MPSFGTDLCNSAQSTYCDKDVPHCRAQCKLLMSTKRPEQRDRNMSVPARSPHMEKAEKKLTIYISAAFLNERIQQCGRLVAFSSCVRLCQTRVRKPRVFKRRCEKLWDKCRILEKSQSLCPPSEEENDRALAAIAATDLFKSSWSQSSVIMGLNSRSDSLDI